MALARELDLCFSGWGPVSAQAFLLTKGDSAFWTSLPLPIHYTPRWCSPSSVKEIILTWIKLPLILVYWLFVEWGLILVMGPLDVCFIMIFTSCSHTTKCCYREWKLDTFTEDKSPFNTWFRKAVASSTLCNYVYLGKRSLLAGLLLDCVV